MEFTKDELTEARRQIGSTLHKLRETAKTLRETAKTLREKNPERCKSQITLAERRIRALEIADRLIEQELTRL